MSQPNLTAATLVGGAELVVHLALPTGPNVSICGKRVKPVSEFVDPHYFERARRCKACERRRG